MSGPGRAVRIDRAVSGDVDWLVATSAYAAGPLADALNGRVLKSRVAVVGARTADAFERAGIAVALTANGPGAEQLITELTSEGISDASVLCLLSDRARPVLADGLEAAGARVHVVTAFRNVPVTGVDAAVLERIRQGRIDAITFASPSAVESFRRRLGPDLPALSSAAFFAIGPTTADALRASGLPVHGEAPTQDAAGFVAALTSYFGHDSRSNLSGVPE